MENHKENQTKAEQKHSEQKHFDPNQALNTLNDLYNRYASLKETIETNITERQRIQANKEEALKRIEATKDVLMTYLNRSFDERALLFKKDFEKIDIAIANNNMEALAIMVQSLNSLAAQSPFQALADMAKVKKRLLSDDEIEI